ncbi:MAG: lysine--tRNA ligase, partial [Nitrososphaerota archaeon]|nr:lysine--tRNA ligase [Nitrososphaerota archaeon]
MSLIVGRGTWIDKVGRSIIEREQQLKRSVQEIRVESGLGASGFPHLGSLSDALRAYAVRLSLEDQGYRSKLIAFSDDMDGLRKVPVGLPKELEQELGKPVSRIRDPLGCH